MYFLEQINIFFAGINNKITKKVDSIEVNIQKRLTKIKNEAYKSGANICTIF